MGSIYKNVGKIHVAVVQDKETRKSQLAQELGALAVNAIMGGFGSPAWVEYMSIFADNEAQLKLLTEAKEDEHPYLSRVRAYIVSNAVCAAGTNTATTSNVEREVIDGAEALIAKAEDEETIQNRNKAVEPPSVITEILNCLNGSASAK